MKQFVDCRYGVVGALGCVRDRSGYETLNQLRIRNYELRILRLSESRAELVRAMPSVGTAVRTFFCILFLCQDKKSMWVWATPKTKHSITHNVGANLVFVPFYNRVRPFFICACTKQIGLRAETQTRLCESERRKTSNCLSRRRVFDVQRTSTRSGSAWCVEP